MPGQGYYRAEGYIRNFNTIEEYRSAERTKVLQLSAQTVQTSHIHIQTYANSDRYGTRYTTKRYTPALHFSAHFTPYPLRI